MKKLPIADLRCDLLGCIEFNKGKYSFESPELNCSIPQLIQGNVEFQVLAISAITQKGSSGVGLSQVEIYKRLQKMYPNALQFMLAIENASALIEEDEPLDLFFKRFEKVKNLEQVVYISLTWNQENRFGGGNESEVGLKKDGEVLLEYLDGKGTAIDLSHTSDQLAFEILEVT